MQEAEREEHRQHTGSAGRYVLVWVALLTLTVLTFVASRQDLGRFHLPVALLIASVKAGLVVLFFMHLWESEGSNRLVFGVAMLFVALLIGLTLADVATRLPLLRPDLLPSIRRLGS
jgi:cytochrome c oxidase subunit IV